MVIGKIREPGKFCSVVLLSVVGSEPGCILNLNGVLTVKHAAIVLVLVSVSACTEVESEQQTTFTHNGRTYPATIRQFDQNGRTFERMSIRVGPQRVSCIPSDPRDCAAAIDTANPNRRGV